MSLRTNGLGRRIAWIVALALLLAMPTRAFAQELAPTAESTRPLVPLYVSFAVLQALDLHSTTRALNAGGAEANPLMQGVAHQQAAMMAAKVGGAASTIWLTHKLAKRNRTAAFILMAAANSAYAVVVAHNYRAGR